MPRSAVAHVAPPSPSVARSSADEPRRSLPGAHQAVLEHLVRESYKRPVVWVRGNHDAEFELAESGQIQFGNSWEIERRLLIVHGDQLDKMMSKHGIFKWLFRRFHRIRVLLGFQNVHVAAYAKRWSLLYQTFSKHVANNALRAARQRGFAAIVCGHTNAETVSYTHLPLPTNREV